MDSGDDYRRNCQVRCFAVDISKGGCPWKQAFMAVLMVAAMCVSWTPGSHILHTTALECMH